MPDTCTIVGLQCGSVHVSKLPTANVCNFGVIHMAQVAVIYVGRVEILDGRQAAVRHAECGGTELHVPGWTGCWIEEVAPGCEGLEQGRSEGQGTAWRPIQLANYGGAG